MFGLHRRQGMFGRMTAYWMASLPGVSHLQIYDKVNWHENKIHAYLYSSVGIQKLLVFEKRILRRIFGPTKGNQMWRVKTNEELDKPIKHKNIINYIKAQRLSWVGHVQRMPDNRTVKKIFNWKPLTKRSQGKPTYWWEDNIKQDICQMKIKNWIACVQDRRKWKEVIEKAKTFN